jgi:DNA (cytosine-5)-methyltransferase 1
MSKIIQAADLFCGAGGTSTGLMYAAEELGINLDLTAINHWDIAIETHAKNHPKARHLCESIERIDPRKIISGGRLHLMWASPECIHHSVARGGVPCSDQSRATAWHIVRWASSIYIDTIIIENVPEFVSWGPLGVDGRPMTSMKGQTFLAFVGALKSLGYRCEYKILNCANYGDATCRHRFFMVCRRGNHRIEWPDETHSRNGGEPLFGNTLPWVPARDIIDWSIPGKSIFTRKKPLSENTLARIEAGLRRYGGEEFLCKLYGTGKTADLGDPLPTVTANGQHIGICRPFLYPNNHAGDDRTYDLDSPIPTLTTKASMYLCQPFLVQYHGNHNGKTDSERRVRGIEDPIPTLDTSNRYGLAMPFILPQQKGGPGELRTRSINDPLPSLTTTGAEALVQPFITIMKGQSKTRGVDQPLPSITTNPHLYLSYLVKYYGQSKTQSIHDPLDTVTTKDRFALIEAFKSIEGADILFRMLQPHELAAAHSFPKNYNFAGNKGYTIKQIGNSVPVLTAQALGAAALRNAA